MTKYIFIRISNNYPNCHFRLKMVELENCNIKLDHSLGCPDDCPNWRVAPGFPIYGVGQPTKDGFDKVISTYHMTPLYMNIFNR